MDKKILVLIPCYNEEENIVATVEHLQSTCPQVDFLVINDCSTDHSADILRAHHYPFLDLPVNLGIGGGVQCGYRFIKKEGFQTSFMRRVGIRFLSWLIHLLCGKRVLDVTSGFRACNARMTAYFARHYAIDYPEPEAILAASLAGFSVGEAPVIMKERQGGVSSIHSFKSAYYMIKVSLALIIDRFSIHKVKGGKA